MNLWTEREKALRALDSELEHENAVIDRAFQQLEYLAQTLAKAEPGYTFGRITGLVAAKGRVLGQATWSLMLDSLGQEAGAIARVWLEAVELLTYLHRDRSRVLEIIEHRLPSAGARAKAIEGHGRRLRKLWNESAAHIGTDPLSWLHMFNSQRSSVKTRFAFSVRVLRQNMLPLFVMLVWNIQEAGKCLYELQGSISSSLALQMVSLRDEGLALFNAHLPEPDGRD